MRTLMSVLVASILAVSSALAAPEPAVSYMVNVYANTTVDTAFPERSVVYPVAQVSCNHAKVAASSENPTFVRFDDPADVSKDCRIDISAQLATLGFGGTYKIAIRANGDTLQSEFSAFSAPFQLVAPNPVTPGNVRVE